MKYASIGSILLAVILLTGCGEKYSVRYNPYQTGGQSSNSSASSNHSSARGTMKPYTVFGKTYYPSMVSIGEEYDGIASWYGPNFHGKQTANGEMYDMNAETAAHKTLPMNTVVHVTNMNNQKSAVVRINDRGPFVDGRIIDVSYAAGKELGLDKSGTAPVKLTVLGFDGVINTQSQSAQPNQKSREITDIAVQIGAYKNRRWADAFAAKNQNVDGIYHAVVKTFANQQIPYKVMLVGFRSEAEARDFIKDGAKEGKYTGSFYVSLNVGGEQ